MKINHIIENQTFDEERALYNIKNTEVKNCVFAGPADGESVLKEPEILKLIIVNFLYVILYGMHKDMRCHIVL